MDLIELLYTTYQQPNVLAIGEHIYRCEKHDKNGVPYQIVYVDTSNKWLEDDLSMYIESIVANDFYERSNYLQWNFYYYFISTHALITEHKSIKEQVEADESFARKFVLTEEDFTSWLNTNRSIGQISKTAIAADLFGLWVNALRTKELFFVYDFSVKNYKQDVEGYINGQTFEDKQPFENSNATPSSTQIGTIREINLKNYRKHPNKKNFKVGAVTLIQGANATGKTSFLDAIELVITGGCNRGGRIDEHEIELLNDSGETFRYPEAQGVYKNRDSVWYKNYQPRGNNLNNNFNRFNYFTSDAAFELKKRDDNTGNDLDKVVADIALGRDVNTLEERINAFRDRFNYWKDTFSNQIDKLSNDSSQKQSELEIYRSELKDPEEYKTNLLSVLSKKNWLIKTDNEPENLIADLDTAILEISNIINDFFDRIDGEIRDNNPYYENITGISYKDLTSKINDLSKLQMDVNSIKEAIFDFQQDRLQKQKLADQFNSLKPLIEELGTYYDHVDFALFKGLSAVIDAKTISLSNHQTILDNYSLFSIPETFKKKYLNVSINLIDSTITQKKGELALAKMEIDWKLQEIEEGISQLSKVLSDIKGLGKQYIAMQPKDENCPLCNSHFENGELAKAIEITQNTFTNSQVLSELKERRFEYGSDQIENETEGLLIGHIKRICAQLYTINPFDATLENFLKNIKQIENDLPKIQNDLIHNREIQARFSISNLSEERFDYLNSKLLQSVTKTFLTKADFDKYRAKFIVELENSIHEESTASSLVTEQQSKLGKLFSANIKDERALSERLLAYGGAKNIFDRTNLHLIIDETDSLLSLSEYISKVGPAFEVYKRAFKEAKQQNTAVDLLTNDIRRISKEILEITPKLNRAGEAAKSLSDILEENNKTNFLKDYIDNNRQEIIDIFTLIHLPREFDNIYFENGTISLHSDGRNRSLNEISTGQRSALALSIFMSLNKKLDQGPNLIMFDDPVAYVDDLNILSFFDYLRELVLATSRQIFFVTANQDLAFLFKKKFEFLGEEELVVEKFERPE